jgi:Recombination endonuclease VII
MTPLLTPLYPQLFDAQAEEFSAAILTRICTKCGIEKPLNANEFHKNKGVKSGYRRDCKECNHKAKADYYSRNKETISNKMKKYREVRREDAKERTRKWREENHEHYLRNNKEWRENNPELWHIQRQRERFKRLGTNQEWYDNTFAAQGYKCAICGSSDSKMPSGTFHVDHDHSCCGSVKACDKCRRGLLCTVCNTRLAHLENRTWKRQAMAYLNKFSKGKKYDESQGSLFDSLDLIPQENVTPLAHPEPLP